MLEADAEVIAKLKGYDFAGSYEAGNRPPAPVFFVPDDTLLGEEANSLGIRSAVDLFGGVVPHPFVKTKAISHGLLAENAEQPQGWSAAFADKVRKIVLPGYTVFSRRDARAAAKRMLERGPIRLKNPLEASGKGQTVVTTPGELEPVLDMLADDELAGYGLVLEENLREATTLSVGQVAIDELSIAYHGRQRRVKDNEGRAVYGGSELVCVRGGWDALAALPLTPAQRDAVAAARSYDQAMDLYAGFIASRRNYDVAQGLGADGRARSGVLEASWRIGGASSAELVALIALGRDPSLQMITTSHVQEYGRDRHAPKNAIVHFQGDDPEAGPLLRYTIVTPSQAAG
jgi:hypothetical protein